KTGNLSTDQRGAVLEVLRTNRSPLSKLLCVALKCFSILRVQVGGQGLASRGARQRCIEMKVRHLCQVLREGRRCFVPPLRLVRSVDRRRVVTGKEPRLELSYPIVAFQKGVGGFPLEVLLERTLRQLTIVE